MPRTPPTPHPPCPVPPPANKYTVAAESATAPSPDAEGSPASPERPTGNKYDQMFGSDNESAQNRDEDEDAGVRKRARKAGTHGDGAADLDADGEADDDDDDKGLFGDDSDDDVQKT